MRFGETVTRLRATTVANPYSAEVEAEDWTSPAELLDRVADDLACGCDELCGLAHSCLL